VLLVNLQYRTDRDSLLMDSRQRQPGPVPVGLPPTAPRHGSIEEAMSLLVPGDSAIFRFQADSAFAQMRQPVPPFVRRGGNALRLIIVPKELVTMEQMQARQQAMMAEQQRQSQAREAAQLPKDNAAIVAYMAKNKLTANAKKTPGGTWYVITKRGTGPLPAVGKLVKVRYRGTVLATGKEFDASDKHGTAPFEFTLGQGQVIQGWDQGIAVLPVGSKATLLIPSPLAYGSRGAGADIPADAPLRFDVELVEAAGAAKPAVPAKKAATPGKKPAASAKKKAPVKK
jgi:FKBP-type peptidyl-prolyl cis-trans isomerase